MLEFSPFDPHGRKKMKPRGKWGKMKSSRKSHWRKLDGSYR